VVVGIGGPLFTKWVMPTEEQLLAKYNPDLRERTIREKPKVQKEFDDFVTQLKEDAKDGRPSRQQSLDALEESSKLTK
jgi:hypothetical protein